MLPLIAAAAYALDPASEAPWRKFFEATPNGIRNYEAPAVPAKVALPLLGWPSAVLINDYDNMLYINDDLGRQKFDFEAHAFFFLGEDALRSKSVTITHDRHGWAMFGDRCIDIGESDVFKPTQMFEGLKNSQPTGECVSSGVPGNLWEVDIEQGKISYCMNGDAPMSITVTPLEGSSYQFRFGPMFTQFDDAEVFRIPQNCGPTRPPCAPTSEEWITKEIYYFHPQGKYELANHNVGDLVGDAVVVCDFLLTKKPASEQFISKWTVDMSNIWGDFGFCKGYDEANRCVSMDPTHVGREITQSMLHNGDDMRCSTVEPGYGWWYSFPLNGKCTDANSGNCSWGSERRIKSVSLDCLIKLGLEGACSSDILSVGLPSTTALIKKAFDTDICTDIVPSQHVLVV
jgi:hypothetical protein